MVNKGRKTKATRATEGRDPLADKGEAERFADNYEWRSAVARMDISERRAAKAFADRSSSLRITWIRRVPAAGDLVIRGVTLQEALGRTLHPIEHTVLNAGPQAPTDPGLLALLAGRFPTDPDPDEDHTDGE